MILVFDNKEYDQTIVNHNNNSEALLGVLFMTIRKVGQVG